MLQHFAPMASGIVWLCVHKVFVLDCMAGHAASFVGVYGCC